MGNYQRIKNEKLRENFNNKKVFEKKKCEKKAYTKIACFQQLFLHSWKAKRSTLWHTYHKSWQGAPTATPLTTSRSQTVWLHTSYLTFSINLEWILRNIMWGFPWKIKEATTKYTYPTNIMSAWQMRMQAHAAWIGLGHHTSLLDHNLTSCLNSHLFELRRMT